MPAATPAEVRMSPSSTKSTSSSSRTRGKARWNSGACAQCVVARRPSSSPAAASTSEPVQMDTVRVPGRMAARASARAGGRGSPRSSPGMAWVGGTITVSAAARASGPAVTPMVKPASLVTGRPSAVQTVTSYRTPPSSARALPKTRDGMPSSNGATPSRASTAIRCKAGMARSCHMVAVRPTPCGPDGGQAGCIGRGNRFGKP